MIACVIPSSIKQRAVDLRIQGKSYAEICRELGIDIPKSTMSGWFSGLELPEEVLRSMRKSPESHLLYARQRSIEAREQIRKCVLEKIRSSNRVREL